MLPTAFRSFTPTTPHSESCAHYQPSASSRNVLLPALPLHHGHNPAMLASSRSLALNLPCLGTRAHINPNLLIAKAVAPLS